MIQRNRFLPLPRARFIQGPVGSRPALAGLLTGGLAILACGGEEAAGPGQTSSPATVASVTVTPSTATLVSLGETIQLTASAQDASGNAISSKTFTWASADVSIATVSASGLVTAAANGSVTIMATTDGINGTAALEVSLCSEPAASIDQQQTAIDATVGGLAIGTSSDQLLAQVVTVGRCGLLEEVRFPVSCSAGDLTVEIQGVDGDIPNGTVLTSEVIPGSSLFSADPLSFRSLALSSPAFFSVGARFAIVLKSAGQCGVFRGPVGDPYSGGDAFFDAEPNQRGVWVLIGAFGGRADLPFQTVVR